MPRIAAHELDRLMQAVRDQPDLMRLADAIERLQRIVFYANPHADWRLQRRSAEQILVAEIVYRYQLQPERALAALRASEGRGLSREAAAVGLAEAIHSYYTTPLGIVMRQDLFGSQAVFLTPDAYEWADQTRGRPAAARDEKP